MNKITKIGKVSILDDEYAIKKEKDLNDLYNYLLSRDFVNFLPIINREDGINYYKYIKDCSLSNYQLGEDIIDTVALLHNKTSYNKEVSSDKYKKIFDDMIGYVTYIDEYYMEMVKRFEYVLNPSPSELLFLCNYSKIREVVKYVRSEMDVWLSMVSSKNKQRICLNHGNLKNSHAIKNDKLYLVSWELNSFDTPISDLVIYYKNEWENLEFSSLLERYLKKCSLSDDERKLLFINLALPYKIELVDDEYKNVVIVRKFFDYLYKTEELIRPYYAKEDKKE